MACLFGEDIENFGSASESTSRIIATRRIMRGKALPEIPADLRMEMARCLLPDIIAFCESEEGKAEFAKWKAEQDAQKEKSKVF